MFDAAVAAMCSVLRAPFREEHAIWTAVALLALLIVWMCATSTG
jgi:hypothetical protein